MRVCETDTAGSLLSDVQQRRGMRHAIASACWGAISQVMIRESSVIIIFASLLGASEMIAVFTTALMDTAVCLLMLPFAYLCERFGKRRQIIAATLVAVVALLLAGAAPSLGPPAVARGILVAGLSVYALAYGVYIAAWLPLLDGIVPPTRRGLFIGRMRFYWQLVAALFIFASGWFVGRHATIGRLQIIILLAALAMLGRAWHVSRIGEVPGVGLPGWRAVWRGLLANRPLVGFSVYLFFLYTAANSFIPVVFLFCRNALMLPDNRIVMLSVAVMVGLILGFWVGGAFIHRYGAKGVFLGAHAGFALLNFLLLTVRSAGPGSLVVVIVAIGGYGLLLACASVAVSSELLALAPRIGKAVSIAFGFTLYSAGMGASRLFTSVILGSGALAETWRVGTVSFTRYHSLFLFHGSSVLAVSILLILVPALVRDVKPMPSV